MRRYEGKVAGLLGTVIVHLLAAILFFSVKLNTLKRESEREFLMVFEALEEKTTVPVSEMQNPENEGISDVDRMISNIVRNLANPDNPVIDPREYQDRVKEEMIQKGLLGEDNFIDDWKRNETEQEAVVIAERVRQEMHKSA
jgi:hypothetical protein